MAYNIKIDALEMSLVVGRWIELHYLRIESSDGF
jgi:hypothetical protein